MIMFYLVNRMLLDLHAAYCGMYLLLESDKNVQRVAHFPYLWNSGINGGDFVKPLHLFCTPTFCFKNPFIVTRVFGL